MRQAPYGGPGLGPGPQRHAAAHPDARRAALREARPDDRLHRLLLAALRLRLRAALAGAALRPQAAQLPERLPLPLPALGLPAHRALLLLLQGLRGGQRAQPLPLLAALLLPRVLAVLHAHAHELVLCAGDFQSQVKIFSRITQVPVTTLLGLPLHQSHFPVGEFNLCRAGEDRDLGEEDHCLCSSGH